MLLSSVILLAEAALWTHIEGEAPSSVINKQILILFCFCSALLYFTLFVMYSFVFN